MSWIGTCPWDGSGVWLVIGGPFSQSLIPVFLMDRINGEHKGNRSFRHSMINSHMKSQIVWQHAEGSRGLRAEKKKWTQASIPNPDFRE